ncbi:helix-turn-helix domain-containing protein [Flaviflexus equikiangi]|uniref:Helix-turn-helix transcriptional regulator n=1 Tax=Flaviflexus equikiangi TaxID=2758573 RepID=A0ABS2TE47_9ACTO|nr:helix-turn-helix transcriptional regulator [Flaviflexus equikiangi]MBM9432373.1 helix-turn-helix transcriptional regulator [Flaviflexus equikiangi]
MSEMPEPWRSAANKVGLNSYRKIAEAAGVSHGTIQRAFAGHRRSVHPDTIAGLARALRVTEAWVSEQLGMGQQTIQPYSPPAEANMLTQRERAAVDELIRLLVQPRQTLGTMRLGTTTLPTNPDAMAYDEIARQKLAEAQQTDYTPAASPHEQPDPHKGVGEGNQDR